jgi:hypothetical protein
VLTIPVLSADLAGLRRTKSHGLSRRRTSRSRYDGKKFFFQEKEVENVDIQASCAALIALVGPALPIHGRIGLVDTRRKSDVDRRGESTVRR